MLVVDASVLAPAVADGGADGTRFRQRLRGELLAAPELVRVEVLSVIRRHLHHGALTPAQADHAVADVMDFPLVVYGTSPLIPRVWALRANVTPYDGCYVALAEALDCALLTADSRLGRATGPRCTIELL